MNRCLMKWGSNAKGAPTRYLKGFHHSKSSDLAHKSRNFQFGVVV